ncbi:MAG: flagellar hook-associated protein FlgL [Bacillota bacterium]|nr:flagellar hook-associated protein FlgL [Bacillota bacterium]
MRITNQMLTANLLRNLQRNVERLAKNNEMLATGRRLSVPSDDPVGIGRSEFLRTALVENEQYSSNVAEARSWLEATDAALEEMGNVLQKARELAVYGANGSLSGEARQALAKEVDQLIQQAVQVANADHGGRFIFAGFQTRPNPPGYTAPYTGVPPTSPWTAVNYNGGPSTDAMEYEIGQGVTLRVNVTGEQAFGPAGSDLFSALIGLRDHLTANNVAAVSNDIAVLDGFMDNLLQWRAEVGARMNRLEATQDRLSAQKVNLTRLLSQVEDADMAQVILDLKMQESIYRAALDSGARIIQPTLLDFLR